MLLEDSKYVAKLGGPIVIYETDGGALCSAIPCEVAEGPHAGKSLKHTATLVTKDGTIQTRTCDNLKEIFGWPGADPFWFMDQDLSAARFEIVTENKQGMKDGAPMVDDKGNAVLFTGVKWMNPLGGGMKMPEAADRKSVLAKYGSKFRALAGGAPLKTPPAAKPAPSGPPTSKPPAKPIEEGPTATMEEAWAALNDNFLTASEGDKANTWFGTMKEMFNTENNSDLTPQQWGKLKEKFADQVPA